MLADVERLVQFGQEGREVGVFFAFFAKPEIWRTVWMNEIPRFYVGKLLLHHYKSDLAHLSDFDSLVIGLSKSER